MAWQVSVMLRNYLAKGIGIHTGRQMGEGKLDRRGDGEKIGDVCKNIWCGERQERKPKEKVEMYIWQKWRGASLGSTRDLIWGQTPRSLRG